MPVIYTKKAISMVLGLACAHQSWILLGGDLAKVQGSLWLENSCPCLLSIRLQDLINSLLLLASSLLLGPRLIISTSIKRARS